MRKILFLMSTCFFLSAGILKTNEEVKPTLVIDAKGHSSLVRGAIFSSDKRNVISFSEDKTIRVWDVKTGEVENTIWGYMFPGKEGRINCGDLSAGDKILAVGGFLPDNEIRLIHLQSSNQVASLMGHTNIVTDVQFSKNADLVASSGADNQILIWKIPVLSSSSYGERMVIKPSIKLEGHSAPVYSVAFSPDSKRLVSASFDGKVKIWEIDRDQNKAREINSFEEEGKKFTSIAFSPDGKFITAGMSNGHIMVWDDQGNTVATLTDISGIVYSLSFSEDSQRLVAVDSRGYATIFEAPMWFKKVQHKVHDGVALSASFLPGNNDVVLSSGGAGNSIKIWRTEDAYPLREFRGEGVPVRKIKIDDQLKVGLVASSIKSNKLNKVFDFNTLEYSLNVPNDISLRTSPKKFDGKLLKRDGDFSLIAGETKINNDKNKDKAISSYCYSPTGNIIVGSGSSLKVYNNEGNMLHNLLGHTANVWSVAVSEDNKRLISSSADQTTKIWDLENGTLLATLFISEKDEWVCWTPDGYYTASAGGERFIGWHVNHGLGKTAKFYPLNTFREKFYQPDYVIDRIKNGAKAVPIIEETISEIEEEILVSLPPEVQWLSHPDGEYYVNENSVNIKVKVSSKTPIQDVYVMVNGRRNPSKRGFFVTEETTEEDKPEEIIPDEPTPEEGNELEKVYTFEVFLTETISSIQIYASNEETYALSSPLKVIVGKYSNRKTNELDLDFDVANFETVNNVPEPQLYLLAIGISDYANDELDLTYADKDAIAIIDMYKKQSNNELVSNVNVKEILNTSATKSNIIEGFDWLEKNVRQQDMVVVFVASHGINYQDNFYIIPHDASMSNVKNTCVNWKDFSYTISKLPSKVLMYIDACNSGQLGSDVIRNTDNTELLRKLSSDENGVVIMSASTGKEFSLENSDWGHGAFTLSILEGLGEGKADYSKDNLVMLRELDLFVSENVKNLTKGKQNPTTQKPSTISSMPVGKVL